MKNISILELVNILKSDEFAKGKIAIVDVRTKLEYDGGHIEGAINRPLDEIEKYKEELEKYDKVYMNCRTGIRSKKACESLESIGLSNLITLDGGIEEWESNRGKVIKERNVISMFRQIMIVAGSLILIGLLGTYFLHPFFIAITAFVGCGLLYAGISDNCIMGKILSKMPWNN